MARKVAKIEAIRLDDDMETIARQLTTSYHREVPVFRGSADEIAPPASGGEALAKSIPNATLKLFQNAGHFVFLDACTTVGRFLVRIPCGDPPGTDRKKVHAETIASALEFFTANLR